MKAIQLAQPVNPTTPRASVSDESEQAPLGFADRLREAFEAALSREDQRGAEAAPTAAEATSEVDAETEAAPAQTREEEEEEEDRDDASLLASPILQTLREITHVPRFEEASVVEASQPRRRTTLQFFGAVKERPTIPAPPPEGAQRTPTVRPAPDGVVDEVGPVSHRGALETSWTQVLRTIDAHPQSRSARLPLPSASPGVSRHSVPPSVLHLGSALTSGAGGSPLRGSGRAGGEGSTTTTSSTATASSTFATKPEDAASKIDATPRNETVMVHRNETGAVRMGLSQVDPSTSTSNATSNATSNTTATATATAKPVRRATPYLGTLRAADIAPLQGTDKLGMTALRSIEREDLADRATNDTDRTHAHHAAANDVQRVPLEPTLATGDARPDDRRELREARAEEIARNLDAIALNGKVRIAADAGDLGRIQIEARRDAEGRIEIDLSSARETTSAALQDHRPELQREASRGELRAATVNVQSGGHGGGAGQRHDGRQHADTSGGDPPDDPRQSASRGDRARRVRIVL